jgi:hypothetical protein
MATRTTLTTRVVALEQELARVKADLARLENFEARIPPTDAAMTIGTVVRWRKQFATPGRAYTYTAIKTNAGWYATGSDLLDGSTWDELVSSLTDRGTLLSLDIATSWDPII